MNAQPSTAPYLDAHVLDRHAGSILHDLAPGESTRVEVAIPVADCTIADRAGR